MENKIGEIVTLPDGRKVEVVDVTGCNGCIYEHESVRICDELEKALGSCAGKYRTDHKNIIYKEIKQ